MAERSWPHSSGSKQAALDVVHDDFLQVRLCGCEPGSPRYASMGGLL